MSKSRETGGHKPTGRPPEDPHAQREAEKYDNPVASRELILELLAEAEHPLSHGQICERLHVEDEQATDAIRRRLRAMERDGQLLVNRRGAYGLVAEGEVTKIDTPSTT